MEISVAPPVRFSAVPEVEKSKSIEAGRPIVLQCEITDPTAVVQWYKDGEQLLPQLGFYIQSKGTTRTLIIQSAEFSRSGLYSCKTADDISEFYVDVKGDMQQLCQKLLFVTTKTNQYRCSLLILFSSYESLPFHPWREPFRCFCQPFNQFPNIGPLFLEVAPRSSELFILSLFFFVFFPPSSLVSIHNTYLCFSF